ncbi:DUF2911 domain-containing protein [Flavobacterium difficile]|uniref:DUF2911 domain-containing protein n=1 Tax=Flavobacterium difficile TaxID=2709659 RepID=A0ABX0I783_9FLAO|nr:DUF2911 domain-containing protein [Flavobacterium difficile]NHM02038.1 DUF2911 domain-containing protein [Flavobacterium difficile]
MKKIIALSLLLVTGFSGAQITMPQASPISKVDQTVGLTKIAVDYHRPSAKGRTVYGELVPYGKNWRTGANENTTITFSQDVMIDGKPLAQGTYALYTTPKADSWDIIFYKETGNWGLPEEWNEEKVALKTSAKPESLNRLVETFTISFNNVTTESANLELSWEKTIVSIKIDVPTQKIVLKTIEDTMDGPSAKEYYTCSQYYYQSNTDLNKALIWINQGIALSGDKVPFWYYRLKSLIQFKLGDKKGAIETAKLSLAGATAEKNEEYIKQNKESIELWSKK